METNPIQTACIKESLRFAMPVPGRLPRIVPASKSGATALTVDGKIVPPGVSVLADLI